MWRYLLLGVTVLVLFPVISGAATALSTQDTVIGSVRSLAGDVFVVHSGQKTIPEIGTRLYVKDVLYTAKNGSMGIVLRDDTAMSIGPSSELVLKEFIFQPKDGLFSSITGFVKGTLVYISGRIARLSPAAATVESPVGIIAVRGTKILVNID